MMLSPDQLECNREAIRNEGRQARKDGVAIMDCPYPHGVPTSRALGIDISVEWLRGWYEQDKACGHLAGGE